MDFHREDKKIGSFSLKDFPADRLTRQDDKERIIKYKKVADKVIVFRNIEYKRKLKNKLISLSGFMFKFEVFSGIKLDFQRQIKEYQTIFDKTLELVKTNEATNESSIEIYTNQIKIGEQNLKPAQDIIRTTKNEADACYTNLLLILFDNDKYIKDLVSTKEFEKGKAREIAEAEKAIKGSKITLIHLKNLKTIFARKEINVVEKKFADFFVGLEDIFEFSNKIKGHGNLLILDTEFDETEIDVYIDQIISNFNSFREIYEELLRIKGEVSYHIESIELNTKRWNEYVKVAVEKAARPILEQILDYMHRELVRRRDIVENEKLKDLIAHMQKGVESLNHDLDDISSKINSIEVDGGFKVDGKEIKKNLQIRKRNSQLCNFQIDNFQEGIGTVRAGAVAMQYNKLLEDFEREKDLLELYSSQHEKYIESYKKKQAEIDENCKHKSQDLENIAGRYLEVKSSVNDFKIHITNQAIHIVFCMMFEYLSLKVNRFWISGEKNYEKVEIQPNELYEIFFKKLKKIRRIGRLQCFCGGLNWCCKAMDAIYHQVNLSYSEFFVPILFKTQVLGSMKNSNGLKQEKVGGFRDEDVVDSLFYCSKACLEIIVLFKMREFGVNVHYFVDKTKQFEESYMNTMENYKYFGLMKKALSKEIKS